MQYAPVTDIELNGVSRDPVPAGLAVESRERQIKIDVPTLIAVSTVASVLVAVLHEVVGHAGAAVLLGIPVHVVSTTAVSAGPYQSLGDYRIFVAAPTVLHLVTGSLALLALRSRMVKSAVSRYFLWLFATISFNLATANLVTANLAGNDWSEFTIGLEPRGLWRAGIVAAGVLCAVVGYVLPLRLWMPDLRENRRLQLKVTAIPVAVLTGVETLGVVPGVISNTVAREDALLVVVGLCLVFFGLWLALVNLVQRPRSTEPVESIRLTRSKTWLAAGLIVLAIFVAVLGPGVGDPR